jgi:NAD(P)H-flavin reductase
MFTILSKRELCPKIWEMVVSNPRLDEGGERIPLTIADADVEKGTITLIVQKVGCTSAKMSKLQEGEAILDVVGPLGVPTHIEKFGTVLCAGGGVGIAPLYPIVQAMKRAGNKVITILAARTAELLILEQEMREYSDELVIMTDDGSYGEKGLITKGMEEVLQREKVDQAVVVGPAIMMKFAAATTQKYQVPTMASLNTIMVDGTGMCGACRCSVGDKTKFVCVDGPEFDAHQVNFDEMIQRLNAYQKEEQISYQQYLQSEKN